MSHSYIHFMIVQRDESPDGEQVPEYVDVEGRTPDRIPCQFIPKSVYESRRGRQVEAGVSHIIELHWSDDLVRPTDRIKNANTGQLLDVVGVLNEDGFGRKMIIKANEVV